MSDRILVLHRGQLTAELSRAQASGDAVLRAAMGAAPAGAAAGNEAAA